MLPLIVSELWKNHRDPKSEVGNWFVSIIVSLRLQMTTSVPDNDHEKHL